MIERPLAAGKLREFSKTEAFLTNENTSFVNPEALHPTLGHFTGRIRIFYPNYWV